MSINRLTPAMSQEQLMLTGGVLYLSIIVVSILGELLIRLPLIDTMDWSVTTENIRNNLMLWRFGIASDLLLIVCGVGLTYVYYQLFSGDQKRLSILACLFLVCTFAVELSTKYDLYAVSILLEDERYLKIFGQQYLNAQINFHYRSYYLAFQNMITFYAAACLVLAILAWRSQSFPKWIAIAFGYMGMSYFISTQIQVLFPELAIKIFPNALALTYLCEASICGWFLLRSVKGSLRSIGVTFLRTNNRP